MSLGLVRARIMSCAAANPTTISTISSTAAAADAGAVIGAESHPSSSTNIVLCGPAAEPRVELRVSAVLLKGRHRRLARHFQ